MLADSNPRMCLNLLSQFKHFFCLLATSSSSNDIERVGENTSGHLFQLENFSSRFENFSRSSV